MPWNENSEGQCFLVWRRLAHLQISLQDFCKDTEHDRRVIYIRDIYILDFSRWIAGGLSDSLGIDFLRHSWGSMYSLNLLGR